MLKIEPKQLNFYSLLYHRIPQKHILFLINSAISLNFVNNLLEKSYCKGFGRPAKEPEMMFRILLIQYLYNLSDEKVIEEIQVNLAFMWFIGINPDEDLPHPSLLAKFRTLRLKDIDLDEIIAEIIRQCIEREIISKDNGIAIDTTHIEANTIKKTPERIMKHLARKIFKEADITDYDIPDYKQIDDPKEAKNVMKSYLEEVISENTENAPEATKEAKEILESDLFIEQKGIRSLTDKDARVGRKSKTQSFYGYKAEIMQTTKEGIITAVKVADGAYVDGDKFNELRELTEKSGIEIQELYGDKAYFRADIIHELIEDKIDHYIPVSASSYKVDEELYSYNKDSDQWFCKYGNETVKKREKTYTKRGKSYKCYFYTFDKEQCRNCPYRDECIKKEKKIAKILNVSENAPLFFELSQRAQTEEFLEKYKKRAKVEPKNAEMKRFHGLARARGYGLISVSFQAKLTVIAVNLKRISKLISPLKPDNQINLLDLGKKYRKIFFKLELGSLIVKISLKNATFSVVSNRPFDTLWSLTTPYLPFIIYQ